MVKTSLKSTNVCSETQVVLVVSLVSLVSEYFSVLDFDFSELKADFSELKRIPYWYMGYIVHNVECIILGA